MPPLASAVVSSGRRGALVVAFAVGAAACGSRPAPIQQSGTAGTSAGAAGTGAAGTGVAGTSGITDAFDAGADVAGDGDAGPPICAAPTVTTPPAGVFSFLSAGKEGTCGLRPDKTLECWGDFGATPPIVASDYNDVSKHGGVCAVRASGELDCWGHELIQAPAGTYVQVVVAEDGLCARRADQTVSCWDARRQQRYAPPHAFETLTGSAFTMCGLVSGTHQIVCWDPGIGADSLQAFDGPFAEVDAGRFFACGLRIDGSPLCWETPYFALGRAPVFQPTPPGVFHGLSVGEFHACALRGDGQATCWGEDHQHDTVTPAGVAFKLISAGSYHNCGILLDGTVTCWGGAAFCDG